MSIEAMKLALAEFEDQKLHFEDVGISFESIDKCITSLSQAIAEAEKQEPFNKYRAWYDEAMIASNEAGFIGLSAAETIRELSKELAAQPAQPKREWVGLTDEEMFLHCPNWLSKEHCKTWIQQIEAKLKEKNT